MPRKISEDQTRKEMIDPQLEKADWYLRDHLKVKTEIRIVCAIQIMHYLRTLQEEFEGMVARVVSTRQTEAFHA